MEENIKVYVQVDSNNVITNINSSIFIGDATGYIVIDEGQGDKYSHAQNLYLEKGLTDMQGKYNYKLVNGEVVELTAEEKEILFPTPTPQPTETELLKQQLNEANEKLSKQEARIIMSEDDNLLFQEYIFSIIGGN